MSFARCGVQRDLASWEELTYDYRFCGEELLPCNCGVARCRGMVNVKATQGHDDAVLVPRSSIAEFRSGPTCPE